jgi:hypothetical protein
MGKRIPTHINTHTYTESGFLFCWAALLHATLTHAHCFLSHSLSLSLPYRRVRPRVLGGAPGGERYPPGVDREFLLCGCDQSRTHVDGYRCVSLSCGRRNIAVCDGTHTQFFRVGTLSLLHRLCPSALTKGTCAQRLRSAVPVAGGPVHERSSRVLLGGHRVHAETHSPTGKGVWLFPCCACALCSLARCALLRIVCSAPTATPYCVWWYMLCCVARFPVLCVA